MLCPECKGFTTPLADLDMCNNEECPNYGCPVDAEPNQPKVVEELRQELKEHGAPDDCFKGEVDQADAFLANKVQPEPTVCAFDPLPAIDKFETGAVRSADKANVAYHLISPIALRRLCEYVDTDTATLQDAAFYEETEPNETIHATLSAIYVYLSDSHIQFSLEIACFNLLQLMEYEETGKMLSEVPRGQQRGFALLPTVGMRRVAETYAEGAKKYSPYNWERGMPIGDILNHAIAHLFAYMSGKDTGEDDLAHAAWNVMAAMHVEETHPELDHQLRFKR